MRTLKFRVYDKKENVWIHGPGKEVNLFGETIILGAFLEGVKLERLNDLVALQFTGLLDKNGKEIYEGDICRCIHSEQNGKNPFEKIEQVYTRPGGFSLFGKPMQDFSYESNNRLTAFNWKTDRSINIPEFYYKIYDIEVIGNIWEHPTLLAEKGGENEAK